MHAKKTTFNHFLRDSQALGAPRIVNKLYCIFVQYIGPHCSMLKQRSLPPRRLCTSSKLARFKPEAMLRHVMFSVMSNASVVGKLPGSIKLLDEELLEVVE